MHFIWDEKNTTHFAEHGVTPAIAEAVFFSPDARFAPSMQGMGRIECEGSFEGRLYRLVFSKVGETKALYPISSFPIRQRRNP